MAGFVNSFKKFIIVIALLALTGFGTVYMYDQFVSVPGSLFLFSKQSLRIMLIVGFWLIVLFFIRRSKSFMVTRFGVAPTALLQFMMQSLSVLVMGFGVLHTLGVSPGNLLVGAGVISLIIGVVLSTFVGNIVAGALVFTTHSFKVGDGVLVNNVPGRILDITAFVTKIRTDVGEISVPNSAIASGGVIMTAIHKHEVKSLNRLPYNVGDRVVTTYMKGEGVVKELTPLYTVIALDNGKELTFLNSSVLTGTVAVAKVSHAGSVQA